MTTKKDVRIIGAGPAGLVAAINLKREGYNPIVQEKQAEVGGEPGWHPSVHTTPVASAGLWRYIGIDLTEAFEDTTERVRLSMGGQDMGNVDNQNLGYRVYNVERGRRPSSLDSILYRVALQEGVDFEFGKGFRLEDLDKIPKGTIIATGLTPGLYEGMEMAHSIFAGYWACAEIERIPAYSAIYYGTFSNEYGYTAAMNGIWYVLLFARREVPQENLDAFRQILQKAEGRTFESWRRFLGQTPKQAGLFHKNIIRTGTFAGFVEPALGFGITGALVSGKIAALAVMDPAKAEEEFRRFTAGIPSHIARKRQPGYAPSVKMGDVWFEIE